VSRRSLVGLGVAVLVYLVAFALLRNGHYTHGAIIDTPLYQKYGEKMRHGLLPYRDFAVEYPPAALPIFLLPSYVGLSYETTFWWFMALFGVCGLVLVALCRPPRLAVLFVAVSPLFIGTLAPTRFDLWPTALMLAGVAALLRDRHRLGWAALAAGFSAKLFPALLMPIAAIWTLRRAGRRELLRGVGIAAGVIVAVFGPFAVVATHGLWESLWGQFSRPLQIESLAASAIMTFGHPRVIASNGSLNLAGESTLAGISTVASTVAIVAVWVGFARGPADAERFVRYGAAAVCAFVAFGKVLSPQYMIWLVPLVPLVRGRRGLYATALLALAWIDTDVWFPVRYFAYVYGGHDAWLVFARDLLLVALFALLSLPGRVPASSESRARLARTRRGPPRFEPLPGPPQAGPGSP
jgi:hypothetical protein